MFQSIPGRYMVPPSRLAPRLSQPTDGGAASGLGSSPPSSRGAEQASQAITNPSPNAAFVARFGKSGMRLRVAITTAKEQVPVADGNRGQLCMAYCLTGTCNSNCRRQSSHRPLTTTEEGRVTAFLEAAGVK
jgi:hypothetical protein